MKRIQYSDAQRKILESILGLTANRIIINFMEYILDFGDFHVMFPMELETGISLTGEQEIKYTYPELINRPYGIQDNDNLAAENFQVKAIQVLQTTLYWEKVDNKPLTTNLGNAAANKTINNLLASAFESEVGHMIKPTELDKHPIDLSFANLADVGVKVDSGDKTLVICPVNNLFGFMDYQGEAFWTEKDLNGDFAETYDLIEIEKKN